MFNNIPKGTGLFPSSFQGLYQCSAFVKTYRKYYVANRVGTNNIPRIAVSPGKMIMFVAEIGRNYASDKFRSPKNTQKHNPSTPLLYKRVQLPEKLKNHRSLDSAVLCGSLNESLSFGELHTTFAMKANLLQHAVLALFRFQKMLCYRSIDQVMLTLVSLSSRYTCCFFFFTFFQAPQDTQLNPPKFSFQRLAQFVTLSTVHRRRKTFTNKYRTI